VFSLGWKSAQKIINPTIWHRNWSL